MRIYLAPSSQPNNAYAGISTNEQIQCYRIAEAAKKAFERNGYQIRLDKIGTSNQTKVKNSNAFGADLHIAIHTNAGGGKGTETLCALGQQSNKYLIAVNKALTEIVPSHVNRGIKTRTDLIEINNTKAVCDYLEIEFHDNPQFAAWIVANVDLIGETIAKGIAAANNQTWIPPTVSPPVPPADLGTITLPITLTVLDLRNAHSKSVTGPDVDLLQGLLMAHGYGPTGLAGPSGRPDGSAGAATKAALLDFQPKAGLTADAVCGAQTWSQLLDQHLERKSTVATKPQVFDRMADAIEAIAAALANSSVTTLPGEVVPPATTRPWPPPIAVDPPIGGPGDLVRPPLGGGDSLVTLPGEVEYKPLTPSVTPPQVTHP